MMLFNRRLFIYRRIFRKFFWSAQIPQYPASQWTFAYLISARRKWIVSNTRQTAAVKFSSVCVHLVIEFACKSSNIQLPTVHRQKNNLVSPDSNYLSSQTTDTTVLCWAVENSFHIWLECWSSKYIHEFANQLNWGYADKFGSFCAYSCCTSHFTLDAHQKRHRWRPHTLASWLAADNITVGSRFFYRPCLTQFKAMLDPKMRM